MAYSALYVGILSALCNGDNSKVVTYDIGKMCSTHTDTTHPDTTHADITLTYHTTLLNITPSTMTFPHTCKIKVKLLDQRTNHQFWIEPKDTPLPCDWIKTVDWTDYRGDRYELIPLCTHLYYDLYADDTCWYEQIKRQSYHVAVSTVRDYMMVNVLHNGSTTNWTTPNVSLLIFPYLFSCRRPTARCKDPEECNGIDSSECWKMYKEATNDSLVCPYLCYACPGVQTCKCGEDATFSENQACDMGHWTSKCISPDMVCDGYATCDDGEDEGRLCEEKRASEMTSGWDGVVGGWWLWVVVVARVVVGGV